MKRWRLRSPNNFAEWKATMSKRVIELIRVSTEGQAASDRASIPAQRSINRRTAQAYGLEIIKSIEISDVSGAAVLYAPEIQELIKLMASSEIHGVVTREFSRLMRPENFSDYALLQTFADTNTILYLPDGPIDFNSKTGRLLGVLRAAIAGNERSEMLERAWAAKEEKRKAGKFAQARACLPFGVDYDETNGWRYTDDAERVREAFRMFLSGETGYGSVGGKLGIDPFNLRVILRNPIYTGWRVIDKKRDLSPAGKILKKDGRQGDRKKIKRAPDEIIRVKVIDAPLISEADFERVQLIMDLKKERHWRTKGEPNYRYTYNGFLTCGKCNRLVYTAFRRRDYYICKGRYNASHDCDTRSMRRELLEPHLDQMFASRLTDIGFLRELASEVERTQTKPDSAIQITRLQSKLTTLQAKRSRVLDTFFEGVIDKTARDAKLEEIDREIAVTKELLFSSMPMPAPSPDLLAQVFEPFMEWEFLKRDDKRKILSTIVPDIRVADYKVFSITMLLPQNFSDEINRTDKGSSPPLT
jgi:DNA invertase Pin-like site-specific DNA recombinase